MGKEKIAEELNNNNIIMQYAPILIALVCLIFCYLLYKKIQTLNSQSDSITNLEKHFTHFIKEQNVVNTENNKKFNSIGTQMNQLNFILQNKNLREVNNINTQMSPDKNKNVTDKNVTDKNIINEAFTRELMPTVTISNIDTKVNELPKPMSTSNKKTVKIDNFDNLKNIDDFSKNKTINVETLHEEILIEEASSDEDN